ncbi:hypothetical protein BDV29DRAFT_184177 [Aspergillus leporis]|uniref:Cellobiose dehydrogenase-like cytochrome domain-containing protein n=1 Tax=Aspergillus leporis TaxID=41062 RepID=A0A5N5WJ73_9EURO|nr:hypothetical protein BDV29DRAFT_184177 [Aspergillus leporis]
MTANIRCESCMQLNKGDSIMGSSSPWGWAMSSGTPLASGNVSATIQMHDYHGIFTVDLTKAIGGNSSNPFLDTTYSRLNVTPSKQLQVDEAFLIRKRIAHGGMTPIAFLLLFPNFAILIHIFPSRYVAWIHALLQMFTTCLALAGLGVGVFVAKDLQVVGGYHQTIGYVVIGGIVLFQPFLGFMQHRHFRKTGETSLYGLSHRWFGRLFMVIGIVNGGLGFHYAYQNTPDIPPAAPIIYGVVCGVVGLIYLFVIMRSRRKARSKTANTVSRTLSGLSNSIEMGGISREKSRLP